MSDGLHIGEHLDPASRDRNGDPALIDPDDLTIHGIIVGMTGSGKTGLGVVCVEEALLQGIPTIVIDPKGDLGTLLLHFPDLTPEDFAPWVEDEDPGEVATRWREGLDSWGIGSERLAALRDAAEFTIYTPGSMAGVPINIVGSLDRPPQGTDAETVGDEIGGYVTGLLNMVGITSDPLSGREHILLTNIIEHMWSAGHDLDLARLVALVNDPPLRKLGVYELEAFYPAADRTKLAMTLNGLLASRAFAAWSEGPDLNIDRLLAAADGQRPACAIVSLAHLADDERQFVVSLLLGKLITWMRRQPGTSKLRVLVYFDEVMGYVPPTAMPPAKRPILTLFKQARAFGVGMLLATQNPVDVDYKGLSNAGTWLIGRLQTEQDQARLLDGLSSAGGEVDIAAVADTIGGLDKREFVLRQAGKSAPELITSRWAMSYLRGPLTRDQIATLMAGRYTPGSGEPSPAPPATAPAEAAAGSADSGAAEPRATAGSAGIPTPQEATSEPDTAAPDTPAADTEPVSDAAGTGVEQVPPGTEATATPADLASETAVAASEASDTAASDATGTAAPATATPASDGVDAGVANAESVTAGATDTAPARPRTAGPPTEDETTPVMPNVAAGTAVRWMDPAAPWAPQVGAVPGTTFAPSLIARVDLTFDDKRLDVRHTEEWEAVYYPLPPTFDAAAALDVDHDDRDLRTEAPPGALYVLTDAPLSDKSYFSGAEKAIQDHLYRNSTQQVLRNRALKLASRVDESPEEFAARCRAAAEETADRAQVKVQARFANRLERARAAVATAGDRAAEAEAAVAARQGQAVASGAGALLGAMLGGRRSARGLARDLKRSMGGGSGSTAEARRVESARQKVASRVESLQDLEAKLADELAAVDETWQQRAAEVETVDVRVKKSDVRVTALALLWIPIA